MIYNKRCGVIIVVTQKELKEVLHYDPKTGLFTWIKTRGFIKKGTLTGQGRLTYKSKTYAKGQLAWLYIAGKYPKHIHYIDGDQKNCKFNNLSLDSDATINKNHVDVGVNIIDDSYGIHIIDGGVVTDLGVYDDLEIAMLAIRGYKIVQR